MLELAFAIISLPLLQEPPARVLKPDRKRIETFHRRITQRIRLAGSKGCLLAADQVAAAFLEAGLEVETEEFSVWLSRPLKAELSLLEEKPRKLPLIEKGFEWDPDSFHGKEVLPHLGYSPSAKLSRHVVYANYGLPGDYKRLAESGIDVRDRIVLVRYGKSFRGVKLKVAEERGAAAILIYSDPADDGFVKGDPYPRGRMRPETGVQRGSALYIFEYPGDPLTPGEPAVEGVKRLRREAARSLPGIPALPIPWAAALPILESLGGPQVPKGWQGGLPLTYHLGPGAKMVLIEVENEEKAFMIRNVFGILEGRSGKEGDFLLLGNHRDSWVHGAVDPATGTAIMLELATLLGSEARKGWKPDYTIRFASWDGEEFGIIGSVEHGEKKAAFLEKHLLAYLNVDSPITGGKFGASSTPGLRAFAKAKAGKILHPDSGKSLLESWNGKPGNLGGGSDFMFFLDRLGIPCLSFGMSGPSGVYHSAFDTHWFVKNRIDPGFRYHACLVELLGECIFALSRAKEDAFRPSAYLEDVGKVLDGKAEALGKDRLGPLSKIRKEVLELAKRAEGRAEVSRRGLSRLGRAWIDEEGLLDRPWFRNLYIAPGKNLGYEAVLLPGLQGALESEDASRIDEECQRLGACLERMKSRLLSLLSR